MAPIWFNLLFSQVVSTQSNLSNIYYDMLTCLYNLVLLKRDKVINICSIYTCKNRLSGNCNYENIKGNEEGHSFLEWIDVIPPRLLLEMVRLKYLKLVYHLQ